MYLKIVKNLQFLAFLYDLGIARKKENVISISFRPIPLQFRKTSRKPKKTKKTTFQDSCKSKNAKFPKNLEKTKKTKKTNIPGLLQK